MNSSVYASSAFHRRWQAVISAGIVLVVVVFAATPVLLRAQGDELFKVIACKGKITLQRTKKPVAIGASLNSADQLKLEGAVYLGLVHKSGKAIEWKQEGTLAMADLLKQVSTKQTTMDKLVGFVVQSVMGANDHKSEVSGSVERGSVTGVRMLLPRTSKIIDPDITFTWSGSDGKQNPTYEFTITDAARNVRFKREVNDTSLTLSTQTLGLKAGQCYYWSAVQIDSSSPFVSAPSFESYCIYPLGEADVASIKAQLAELQQSSATGVKASALDNLVTAMLYEQNGLTYRAFGAYREALASMQSTGGDVEVVQQAYTQFLRRIGIDAATQKLIK